MKQRDREDFEDLCLAYMSTFLEVKEYLLLGECSKALKCLNAHAREIDDARLALSGSGTLGTSLYENPADYEEMYDLLFNAVTDALRMMYERKYDAAATHLMLAQRKTERIFMEGGKSYT